MIGALRLLGDPGLRTETHPVRFDDPPDPRIQRMGDRLVDLMHRHHGVGFAANQAGYRVSMFAWDVGNGANVLANPVLEHYEGDELGAEGCLSVPGFTVPVRRPTRVVVSGITPAGKPRTVRGSGLLARVLCHELDHLAGLVLLDQLPREWRRIVFAQMRDGICRDAARRAVEYSNRKAG